jgi:hypothetical protein
MDCAAITPGWNAAIRAGVFGIKVSDLYCAPGKLNYRQIGEKKRERVSKGAKEQGRNAADFARLVRISHKTRTRAAVKCASGTRESPTHLGAKSSKIQSARNSM